MLQHTNVKRIMLELAAFGKFIVIVAIVLWLVLGTTSAPHNGSTDPTPSSSDDDKTISTLAFPDGNYDILFFAAIDPRKKTIVVVHTKVINEAKLLLGYSGSNEEILFTIKSNDIPADVTESPEKMFSIENGDYLIFKSTSDDAGKYFLNGVRNDNSTLSNTKTMTKILVKDMSFVPVAFDGKLPVSPESFTPN